MWYLACCDDDGKCFGFLKKDKSISIDPDNEMKQLMSFNKKSDTNEIVLQVNLSHSLLPDGTRYNFRLCPVKV